jgi:hypothetical protein
MLALSLFRGLCTLFGKACVLLALLFVEEMEILCADALEAQRSTGRSFLVRCRSGLAQARSRLLWGAPEVAPEVALEGKA